MKCGLTVPADEQKGTSSVRHLELMIGGAVDDPKSSLEPNPNTHKFPHYWQVGLGSLYLIQAYCMCWKGGVQGNSVIFLLWVSGTAYPNTAQWNNECNLLKGNFMPCITLKYENLLLAQNVIYHIIRPKTLYIPHFIVVWTLIHHWGKFEKA